MAGVSELKFLYNTAMTNKTGLLTKPWQEIFQFLKRYLDPLGFEKTFTLENGKLTATKIPGLRVDLKNFVTYYDFVIVRQFDVCAVQAGRIKVVRRLEPTESVITVVDAGAGPDTPGVVIFFDEVTGEGYYTSEYYAPPHKRFTLSVRQSYLSGGNLIG